MLLIIACLAAVAFAAEAIFVPKEPRRDPAAWRDRYRPQPRPDPVMRVRHEPASRPASNPLRYAQLDSQEEAEMARERRERRPTSAHSDPGTIDHSRWRSSDPEPPARSQPNESSWYLRDSDYDSYESYDSIGSDK